MNAGLLRERVTFQIASGSTNTLGETVLSWSNSTSVWASVQGITAREFLLFGQQQTEVSHRVKMRYVPGINSQMRLSWRNRTLEIVSILENANRSEHELLCQETQ